MPSPQVQNWLEEGSQLREDLLAQMEKLEAQRHELDQMLNERRTELSLLARILDRADHEPAPAAPAIDDPFNPAFTSKAGVSVKTPSKDVWHAAMS
jgi:hypothetical protein